MGIERTEFSSGLRVVTSGCRRPLRVLRLGARRIPRRASAIGGSSHFLEHLLFKGTRRGPPAGSRRTSMPSGGDVNAFASKEYTSCCTHPRRRPGMWSITCPTCSRARCSVGRSRCGASGDPRGDQHARGLARGGRPRPLHRSPLAEPSAGRPSSAPPRRSAATRDKVHRFYRKHYVPGGLVVAAGNLRRQELLDMLRRRMTRDGSCGRGTRRDGTSAPAEPPESSAKPLVKRRKTEQAHICLGTNGLAGATPTGSPS